MEFSLEKALKSLKRVKFIRDAIDGGMTFEQAVAAYESQNN
jgi:hypothetical protein